MYHMKILLPDFNAKLGRQYIFRPTNRNESSYNDSNENGAKVVKHNSQLLKVTVVWQIFHFCLSQWTNISTLKTSSTYERMTLHKTSIYYHKHPTVRKISWKIYQKEMGNAFCAVNNSDIITVMINSNVLLLTKFLSTEVYPQ